MAKSRKQKGKSLVGFPDEYVVVDTETTGLSPGIDSIIEFGAVRYRNHEVIDTFSTLVKPDSYYSEWSDNGIQYISPFISSLTHITNEMLDTAPLMEEVLPEFLTFVKDSYIVGHNVNFDVNFIYDTSLKYGFSEYSGTSEPLCPILRATHSGERAILSFRSQSHLYIVRFRCGLYPHCLMIGGVFLWLILRQFLLFITRE